MSELLCALSLNSSCDFNFDCFAKLKVTISLNLLQSQLEPVNEMKYFGVIVWILNSAITKPITFQLGLPRKHLIVFYNAGVIYYNV